jgi:hypothetical protein
MTSIFITLPSKYNKFRDAVFSKEKSQRSGYDLEISLRPDEKPPYGRIYDLSEEKLKILKEYLAQIQKRRLIRPSKSEAASLRRVIRT